MIQLVLLLLALFQIQCQTTPLQGIRKSDCSELQNLMQDQNIDFKLNVISEMYYKKCYTDLIQSAQWIRKVHRDKFYSLTTEFSEVFFPEGSMSDYVLESYERAYLSLLMSLSYYQQNNIEMARIEFLNSIDESNALLYNYGSDPTITVLQAAIADSIPINVESRPFWKKITEFKKINPTLNQFAQNRIQEIDQHVKKKFEILSIGQFPEMNWHPHFLSQNQSNYEITTNQKFPEICHEEVTSSLLLPTESWFQKISNRYDKDYHPLLNAKSWARLPAGIAYGAATVTLGGTIAFSGCAMESAIRGNNGGGAGALCRTALEVGGELIAKSADVLSYTMKPDLRHWQHLPIAFFIIDADKNLYLAQEKCVLSLPSKLQYERRVFFYPL